MQRAPDYWLRAHRYTDSMTLIQALKENMGNPRNKRAAVLRSLWKSDRIVVVRKRCNGRRAKDPGHLSEQTLNNFKRG